jgi:hypothetical protein
MQKDFSENLKIICNLGIYSHMFASPVLDQKSLKSIILKGHQIISLPVAPTCVRPAVHKHGNG